MKRIKILGWWCCWVMVLVLAGLRGSAQSSEAKQLLLNTEKLAQLKNILSDMKKGYEILAKGYGTVKNIAEGNFSLHKEFLDGLLVVSPAVKKYRRVADILSCQRAIVSGYRSALRAFRASEVFSSGDLAYMSSVYSGLLEASLLNLEDLALVITSSKLRMNDKERLAAIDRIYLDSASQREVLRRFNSQALLLYQQKLKEKRETSSIKSYYGILKGGGLQ